MLRYGMFWLIVLLFVLGACIGSFLNVVVYRTMYGESPLKGRSKCDHCGKLVGWRQNIPLLSFFVLRGRCANCKKKISWQYPVVEFITGILFVWWFVVGRSVFLLIKEPYVFLQPVFWLGVGVVLLLVFVFEILYMVIPDFLTLGLFVWAFGYRLILVSGGQMQRQDLLSSLVAGATLMGFFLSLYLLTKRRGFGLGDVKLAPSLGLILGYQRLMVGVFLAFVLGAVVGVMLLLAGKRRFGQVIAFGPFLVLASVLSLLFGSRLWSWYVGNLLH